jgi:hypothetical protein
MGRLSRIGARRLLLCTRDFYDLAMANLVCMNHASRGPDARIDGPSLSILADMLYRCNLFIGMYTVPREQLLALERRLPLSMCSLWLR